MFARETFAAVESEDSDREAVLESVQKYFLSALEEEENSGSDDKVGRIHKVLAATEDDEFGPAFEYLTEEIKRLEKLRGVMELAGTDAAKKAGTAGEIDREIAVLEKLLDSLDFSE
jgi:cation transport regulator ChaC